MSDPTHVYMTTDPQALAAFRTARAAYVEYAGRVARDAAELGNNGGAMRGGNPFGPGELVGLAADAPADPPPGWVYSKRGNRLQPRRGAAGAPAREWMAAHQPPTDERTALVAHGLPRNDRRAATGDGRFVLGAPELFEHDDALWAMYRGTPDGTWCNSDGTCTWDQVPLSRYYAAKEAAQHAFDTREAERRAERAAATVEDRGDPSDSGSQPTVTATTPT